MIQAKERYEWIYAWANYAGFPLEKKIKWRKYVNRETILVISVRWLIQVTRLEAYETERRWCVWGMFGGSSDKQLDVEVKETEESRMNCKSLAWEA